MALLDLSKLSIAELFALYGGILRELRDRKIVRTSNAPAAYPNLTYFNEVDRGGHFAAWEQPQLFSEEIRAAFKSLR